MKVLYLSYDGMTDQLGQSQVLPYLKGLADLGHTIHLISCEKKDRLKKNYSLIKHLTDDSKIIWHPLPYHKKPPILSTLIDIRQLKSKAFDLQNEIGFDIVHCRSYITPFVGLYLKKTFGVKFIFDMRGFFADERVDGKIWNLNNPVYAAIYHFFKKKEKEFLINADHIISLTNNAEKILLDLKLKNEPLPITVIPCCADLNHFNYERITLSETLQQKNNLNINPNSFVLCYLGAIGTWYMLDEMLDFFKHLQVVKKNVVFLFITNEAPSVIENLAQSKSIPLNSLRILGAQRSDVPLLLSIADVAIFFIKPTFSKKASSPTKQGEIMGMGIPLICNAGVGDTDQIVESSSCGYAIEKFTSENYEAAINQLDELVQIDKATIRNGAKKFYSLTNGVRFYHTIYEGLAASNTK